MMLSLKEKVVGKRHAVRATRISNRTYLKLLLPANFIPLYLSKKILPMYFINFVLMAYWDWVYSISIRRAVTRLPVSGFSYNPCILKAKALKNIPLAKSIHCGR